MNQYADLLEQERKRLEALRMEIDVCVKRIQALEFLAETGAVSARHEASYAIGTPSIANQTAGAASDYQPTAALESKVPALRIRKDSIAVHILPFIGTETKTLDEIIRFLNVKLDKTLNRGNVRTILMNLRTKNGLVENPTPGRYRLSEMGLKWLRLGPEMGQQSIIEDDEL